MSYIVITAVILVCSLRALSAGAGLVTVLFVFAINIAGDDPLPCIPTIPKPVSWLLILATLGLGAWLTLSALNLPLAVPEAAPFATVLWQDRTLDALLQVVLIFAGVLTVLGLLYDGSEQTAKEPRS